MIWQVQRRCAGGEERGGGDGVGVGHDGGVQGGGGDGGQLDGGDERGGAGGVFDGGELVRRGDGVELEGGERGDDWRSERERDRGELREREVRRQAVGRLVGSEWAWRGDFWAGECGIAGFGGVADVVCGVGL